MKLKPMSEFERWDGTGDTRPILVKYRDDQGDEYWHATSNDYTREIEDVGWCFIDELEIQDCDEENPVYWGDVAHSAYYGFVTIRGGWGNGAIACERCKTEALFIWPDKLLYNGKPVTGYCVGKRERQE